MAYSESQLDNLEKAIAQGALSVRFNERQITYHSIDEMIKLRDAMRMELGISPPVRNRGRFVTFATGKGL